MKLFQTQSYKILVVYQGIKSSSVLKSIFLDFVTNTLITRYYTADIQIFRYIHVLLWEMQHLSSRQAPEKHYSRLKLVKNRPKTGAFRHFWQTENIIMIFLPLFVLNFKKYIFISWL